MCIIASFYGAHYVDPFSSRDNPGRFTSQAHREDYSELSRREYQGIQDQVFHSSMSGNSWTPRGAEGADRFRRSFSESHRPADQHRLFTRFRDDFHRHHSTDAPRPMNLPPAPHTMPPNMRAHQPVDGSFGLTSHQGFSYPPEPRLERNWSVNHGTLSSNAAPLVRSESELYIHRNWLSAKADDKAFKKLPGAALAGADSLHPNELAGLVRKTDDKAAYRPVITPSIGTDSGICLPALSAEKIIERACYMPAADDLANLDSEYSDEKVISRVRSDARASDVPELGQLVKNAAHIDDGPLSVKSDVRAASRLTSSAVTKSVGGQQELLSRGLKSEERSSKPAPVSMSKFGNESLWGQSGTSTTPGDAASERQSRTPVFGDTACVPRASADVRPLIRIVRNESYEGIFAPDPSLKIKGEWRRDNSHHTQNVSELPTSKGRIARSSPSHETSEKEELMDDKIPPFTMDDGVSESLSKSPVFGQAQPKQSARRKVSSWGQGIDVFVIFEK